MFTTTYLLSAKISDIACPQQHSLKWRARLFSEHLSLTVADNSADKFNNMIAYLPRTHVSRLNRASLIARPLMFVIGQRLVVFCFRLADKRVKQTGPPLFSQ